VEAALHQLHTDHLTLLEVRLFICESGLHCILRSIMLQYSKSQF
jgi:hypothetical protein